MTETEVIDHWRKGARIALHAAHVLHEDGTYALALFNVHLAVEKTLKVLYMQEHGKEPPPTHNLPFIGQQLHREWKKETLEDFLYLTQYAIAARYDDPPWAEREATEENSASWLKKADDLLSDLLP